MVRFGRALPPVSFFLHLLFPTNPHLSEAARDEDRLRPTTLQYRRHPEEIG